jgi:glycerol-3-phosphate acyltransferase PlsY
VTTVFAIGLTYLLGSIPFGLIVTQWFAGIDVRTVGSGNIGATNVGRTLGFWFFAAVFFLDLLKGYVPTAMATWWIIRQSAESLEPNIHLPVLVGAAAILGHVFSVFLNFRGGKGVATCIGVFAALDPVSTFMGLIAFAAVFGITRIVAVSSLAFVVMFAIRYFWSSANPWGSPQWPLSLFVVLAVIFLGFTHRSNFVRLLAGKENRIGKRRGQ